MLYKNVILEKENQVASIILNRPDKMNSFDFEMQEEIDAAVSEVADDPGIRAMIVTGSGKAFCTGFDVSSLKVVGEQGFIPEAPMATIARGGATILTAILKIRNMRKPVIAALNGVAAGAGVGLALACDIRIASTEARLNLAFIKRGLSPDSAITYHLPRLVGMAKACEIVFTDDVIDASEADRIGLVNKVVPPKDLMDLSKSLAGKIAQNPPLAIGLAKGALYKGGVETDIAMQMAYEIDLVYLLKNTADFKEGVNSFLEKRPPEFKGV
ncbi:enoyl-CoA hydratase/isomerase family protein [Chloroflexota bacterium]